MTKITRFADPKDPLNKDKFTYKYADGTVIKDAKILEWILALRIPPAWTNVTINYGTTDKQTCCGYDPAGRMQCLYSTAHKERAKKQKYCDLIKFGEKLPQINADMKTALASERYTMNKVIAIVLRIVTCCGFRLGTLTYEAQNESYGITTIRREHIKFDKGAAHISFIGKKGVHNECTVTDPEIVRCLQELVAVKKADDHVMQYQHGGEWHHLRHVDVNSWLKERGETFTSKDFRTFTANVVLIDALKTQDPNSMTVTARKKAVNAAADLVADTIHNTRAITKKDYCDPEVIEMYIDHPVRYRKMFITPGTPARNMFINYLKMKCVIG
jgi:DNA topoisomerase IB